MCFSKDITPSTPALIIIAIDQSGSMLEAFEHVSMIVSKSEIAAMIASALIDELSARARHADKWRHYFDIVVLGYSGIDAYPLLGDNLNPIPITMLEGREPKLIERIFEYITDDNHLQLVQNSYHEWIKPKAAGPTPMLEMLDRIADITREWCTNRRNNNSLPPIVFNITDGLDDMEYTTLHKLKCDTIKSIGTSDGNCMIVNVCVDSCPKQMRLNLPESSQIPPSHPASMLAQMSSPMPQRFTQLVKKHNHNSTTQTLALCYNATALEIIPYLSMATE